MKKGKEMGYMKRKNYPKCRTEKKITLKSKKKLKSTKMCAYEMYQYPDNLKGMSRCQDFYVPVSGQPLFAISTINMHSTFNQDHSDIVSFSFK